MRKLIVSEFVTLDGVMEAPGGEPGHPHTGWAFEFMANPEEQQYKLDEVLDAESLLLGRVTYESFADAWPGREGRFADKMNRMPKHVATTTRRDLEWDNATVLEGDVAEAVARLKAGDGGPILVAGSRTLVHTLLQRGLVDELRMMIFPVAVGTGHKLFPETPDKTVLTLAGAQVFDSGAVVLTYLAPSPT